MVVILNEDSYGAWLDASVETSMDCMREYPAERLEALHEPVAKAEPVQLNIEGFA